jgi:hypothetical protein
MTVRLIAVVLLLALLNACATQHQVRLGTGQGAPREYTLPPSPHPVEVDKGVW